MKFVQLIEYNIRNIFLEKSYTESGGEIIPRPFQSQDWAYLWINSPKYSIFCFYYIQVEGYHNILKLHCKRLAFISYKAFLKNKDRFQTSLST